MNEDSYVFGDYDLAFKIDCEKLIQCCRFHPKGDVFAVGLADSSINIYRKNDAQLLYTLNDSNAKGNRLPVTCLRFFNPKDDTNQDHYKILIATYVSGFVKFWHYPSMSLLYTIVDSFTVPLCLDLNLSNSKLTIGGYNSALSVYDVSTKKLLRTLESSNSHSIMDGHVSRVFCVKYNPIEENQMFTGGWDNTVHIWDDRIQNSQNHIYGPHICGDAIDIDTRHNHLLTGSYRKTSTLEIWDLRTNQLIRDVFESNENTMIHGAQWLGDDSIFIGGSQKNFAGIYDRGSLALHGALINLTHSVVCIDNDRSNGRQPHVLICCDKFVFIMRKKPLKFTK